MKIFLSSGKNSRVLPALASPTIRYLMRVSLFISCLLALSLQLSALHSSGQTIEQIEVTLEFRNARLSDVLRQIQKRSGVNFVYSPDHVNVWKHITVQKERRTVKKLLDLVLGETTLTYKEEAGTVVILKMKTKSTVEPGKTSHPQGSELLFFPITGTVKDRNGSPLPGVNIVVKGTARGTSTDADGKFTVDISDDETLVLSFIGYKTLEVSTRSLTVLEIIMEEDITTLQAVEVIGTDYFNTTKAKSTMNISKVEGEEIQDQPVTTIMNALVGRVPGIDIIQETGFPGRASAVQIRGTNSLTTQGATPLYVIDGVQIDARPLAGPYNTAATTFDPLAGIGPGNIESIEVLKDAAATAIYGSRGANGVIRITTKRAKLGHAATNFDFNVYTGIGKVVNEVQLLNREQYLAMRREGLRNAGASPGFFDYDLNGAWDTTRYTNWQQELLGGTANITDVQGALSGGNETTSFRVGGGYHKETTVFPGSDFGYQRATADFSFRHLSSNKKLTVSAGINFGHSRDRNYNFSQFVSLALTLPPVAPKLYNDDGTLNWQEVGTPPFSTWYNPLAELKTSGNNMSNTILASGTIGYEIFQGFVLKTMMSLSSIVNEDTRTKPKAAFAPFLRPYLNGSMNFVNNDRRSFMLEPQLTLNREYGDHELDTSIGLTYQKSSFSFTSVEGTGYPSDALLGSIRGATTVTNLADEDNQYKYISAYAHIGYNFKQKYLLDLTGRRDGSSRFGPGKRYGNFWAVGGGWVFSAEPILKNNLSFLSFGKLRTSYGVTGNDQIADYQYLDTYDILSFGYQNGVSLVPRALHNPDYAWEETRKYEVAIELGFFANRVLIEGARYRNVSSNQLVSYPLSDVTGFQSVMQNFDATIENTGWEFTVDTKNVVTEDFRWTTSFNLSIPRNKLLKFDGLETSSYATRYKVGEPLSIQRLFTYKGIDSETGFYNVEDVNNDGVYDDHDTRFSTALGRTSYYGLSNTFEYKNVHLSFLLQFSNNPISSYLFTIQPGGLSNQPIEVLDRWQHSQDNSNYQKFVSGYDQNYANVARSDQSITDASFVRLKTVSLSYKLPTKLLEKSKFHDARIYLQGQNLFTITKFNGFDPETGNNMPPLKIVSLGVQIHI